MSNATRFQRETQRHDNAHIFGHFDSRGGSTLVLGHKSTPDAIVAYEKALGWDHEDGVGHNDLMDGEGRVTLVVCDRPLPDRGELLGDYVDDGYLAGRLQSRRRKQDDWRDEPVVVLWADTRTDDEREEDYEKDETGDPQKGAPEIVPPAGPMAYRLRRVRLGDDAFGLFLVPPSSQDAK